MPGIGAVIPVYGKRWYIDNQERFAGYVQPRMDRQRVYNSQISRLAETAALAPREKPIFLAEQMPPELAEQWADQEVKRHPYALVKAIRNASTRSGAAIAAGSRKTMALSRIEKLSKREREILAGMVDGLSNRLIGKHLSISPRTVELHRANLLSKIGARHSAEAIRLAIEASLPSFEAAPVSDAA